MKIDIRKKLQMQEKPVLQLTDEVEVTVDNDAMNLLSAMDLMDKGQSITGHDIQEVMGILFSKNDVKKLKDLKLNLPDFQTVIEEAIDAASGIEKTEKN